MTIYIKNLIKWGPHLVYNRFQFNKYIVLFTNKIFLKLTKYYTFVSQSKTIKNLITKVKYILNKQINNKLHVYQLQKW